LKPHRKLRIFVWRAMRNAVSATSFGRRLLFPPQRLATSFGSDDADYAWSVYREGHKRLHSAGFQGASRVLEVGPGRNLGTALLWWAAVESHRPPESAPAQVVTWDIYANVTPSPGYFAKLAQQLLACRPTPCPLSDGALALLRDVAAAAHVAPIHYLVCSRSELTRKSGVQAFDLIYSQAALEHVWDIACTWQLLADITLPDGWHYHTIDLADHGRRESDPYEMLEWSPIAYWLTGRFIPGAVNRWRASEHTSLVRRLGFIIVSLEGQRSSIPFGDVKRFNKRFRSMGDLDLATTMIRIVLRKAESSSP
jgi:hypothetical protein